MARMSRRMSETVPCVVPGKGRLESRLKFRGERDVF